MTVALPAAKYNEPNRRISFHDQLKERITALPGVGSASVEHPAAHRGQHNVSS
jgi:hypothetical protein